MSHSIHFSNVAVLEQWFSFFLRKIIAFKWWHTFPLLDVLFVCSSFIGAFFLHILLFFDVSNYSKFFAFHVHFLMICSTRIKPITLHGVMWCYSVASLSLFHIHSQWIAGTRRFLELFHLFYLISRFHCTRGQLNVNVCICVTSAVFLLFFSALTQKPSNRFQHLSGHNSFVFMKCRRFHTAKMIEIITVDWAQRQKFH